MPDLLVLAGLVARLESWLKWLIQSDARHRTKWQRAVAALQAAVVETQAYVAGLRRHAKPDRTVENQLSRTWQSAATEFYGIDGRLAERLQLKAEYWTQPEDWTEQQVIDAGISLQRVAEYTRQLLRES